MATRNITVKVGSNTKRETVIFPSDMTVKSIMAKQHISIDTAQLYLDGGMMGPGDSNKTLDELGVKDDCILIAVVKTDNA